MENPPFWIVAEGGSTFCCRPLITYQQGQSGLSTVGAAHLLAVDWLGLVCYLQVIVFTLH
jgi:hypothetical protein